MAGAQDVLRSTMERTVERQIETGTQTVTLQGRVDDTHDWVDITQTSADDASLITVLPEMRVVTSATSGGSSVVTVAR